MGQGFFWQDLQVGQQLRTFRRTVTEADLVAFINATGMLEAIFIEEGYDGGAIPGRPVPGAMTYALIEGFILQSMIKGTGLAMLELQQKILGEVTAIKPTSRGNRAVVTSRIEVFNQGHQKVMEYTAVRLLAGRG
jgi:acyl dehydratase